ncbi:MAG: lipid A biosynthesis acyltransferase [Rhodoferax sp.]
MLTRILLSGVRLMALLPLSWLRALGGVLGLVLYVLVVKRRRVVWINLRWCFPQLGVGQVRRLALRHFICVAQSWLDRGWLWHGRPALVRRRLHLRGALAELAGTEPTVLFAPHFVGMDAAWTALTQQVERRFITIYTNQANPVSDAWILAGRRRFGAVQLCGRIDGVKPIVAGLRSGALLYLLPDMNFGPHESVFVPFYGVPAATVPSLSRFARLGRAKVQVVLSRLTSAGYEIEVLPAWSDFPGSDLIADTALMNRRLQDYIDSMPAQYYWVHKRFKDRPDGAAPPY